MQRKKLRVRVYDSFKPDSVGFLEIKTKDNQLGGKFRAKFLAKDLQELFSTFQYKEFVCHDLDILNQLKCGNKFFYHYLSGNMSPVILVTYEREAFYGRFDPSLRITFDKNIRFQPYPQWCDIYNDESLTPLSKQNFVLEIKFNKGFDPWLTNIISQLNLVQISFSKYCNCIDESRVVKPFHHGLVDSSFSEMIETNKVAV